jgi:hypothetical protein
MFDSTFDIDMRKRLNRLLTAFALLIVLSLVAAFNVININEAFGDGPPYYARTTNMDKWSNPLPVLAIVDATALALTALLIYRVRR